MDIPAIADLPTSIPGFVGYTETAIRDGADLTLIPTRIGSLSEYERWFGGGRTLAPGDVEVTVDRTTRRVTVSRLARAFLYDSLRLFFDNGGTTACVVSVGSYRSTADLATLRSGVAALRSAPEVAIVVVPDAMALEPADQVRALQQAMLQQCADVPRRFAVLDLSDRPIVESVPAFREGIGTSNLAFGAAYAPWVVTESPRDVPPEVLAHVVRDEENAPLPLDGPSTDPALKREVSAAVTAALSRLPPSGAVAGVYAAVDEARGVWKAPANVALRGVLAPAEQISDFGQQELTLDPAGGKSVNALRAFASRGTLVWGARTLAGNDDEWRYVPVRRFISAVEASVSHGTQSAVFEPNAAPLWQTLKTSISNYLSQKWRAGALAGAKTSEAFFVKVGLGETMTVQDVADGRLVIDMGLAVLRPAEFIIVRVQHRTAQP